MKLLSWWRSVKDGRADVAAAKRDNVEKAEAHETALEKVIQERGKAAEEQDELREVVKEVVRRLNRTSRAH